MKTKVICIFLALFGAHYVHASTPENTSPEIAKVSYSALIYDIAVSQRKAELLCGYEVLARFVTVLDAGFENMLKQIKSSDTHAGVAIARPARLPTDKSTCGLALENVETRQNRLYDKIIYDLILKHMKPEHFKVYQGR